MKRGIFHIVLMLIAAVGLLVLTGSFFMSLGIFIALILTEYIIIDRVDLHRRRRQREDDQQGTGSSGEEPLRGRDKQRDGQEQ